MRRRISYSERFTMIFIALLLREYVIHIHINNMHQQFIVVEQMETHQLIYCYVLIINKKNMEWVHQDKAPNSLNFKNGFLQLIIYFYIFIIVFIKWPYWRIDFVISHKVRIPNLFSCRAKVNVFCCITSLWLHGMLVVHSMGRHLQMKYGPR